jgi:RNA polymerase sigma-70 factor (ECF subfamily)
MEPAQPRPPAPADDAALVAAAQRDPSGFGPLYERYVHRIYQYSLYRTNSATEAEEVTAQTFMRAMEYIGRYRWRGAPFVVWLYRIADSVIHKSRRKPRPGALPPDLAAQPADAGLDELELRQDLLREVYALPELQQTVLILRFAQGLTYDEIAAVTGRRAGALRQMVHRALQVLRERMGRA